MKYIVPESNLKSLLKNTFGLDLTGKVFMITSSSEVPFNFDKMWHVNYIRILLNNYGPMYLFEIKRKDYIAQKRENSWRIVDSDDVPLTEFEFMKLLGIQVLGLSIDNLLDLYVEEE